MESDTGRKWWPEDHLDESMPGGRVDPSAWIIAPADEPGTFWMAGWDDDAPATLVKEGQVVGFCWMEDRGEVDVTVQADGTFELHGGVPADTTHFWLLGEFLGDTMEQLVKEFVANCEESFPQRVSVDLATWSDRLPHRLVIDDGKPRFVPATETQH